MMNVQKRIQIEETKMAGKGGNLRADGIERGKRQEGRGAGDDFLETSCLNDAQSAMRDA
jgi:hypothetical protein